MFKILPDPTVVNDMGGSDDDDDDDDDDDGGDGSKVLDSVLKSGQWTSNGSVFRVSSSFLNNSSTFFTFFI
jgi:hypothetical protein